MGHDGRTSHERLKGKKARWRGIKFGEAVMWKRRPQDGPLGKIAMPLERRHLLRDGVKGSTGE